MSKISLGKKNNFEKGTFVAYACNCNCFAICGTCNNCNYTTPQESGTYYLDYAQKSKANTTSFSALVLFG